MDHSFPLLSEGQVVELAANFMRDEVQTILFSMDPLKALRLDGFPTSFFQNSWSVVGDSTTDMVLAVLWGSALPPSISDFLNTLIPKV